MTPRPALSTPRPLPRKRERANKRPAITLASVDGNAVSKRVRGLAPAKAIQRNEAPADARRGMHARLDALCIEIRALVSDVSHSADIVLLDLMADDAGSYSRHRAAQDARTWAAAAGVTLETGLMQLGRAIPREQN
ncbi:hypothetical protein Y027_6050 [Burkholderia pseudomallei TSV5]|uniref:hypothetical protein n=1 Tax=Burkholderia pseudomallei TaxID=28450 RepID=UPI0005377D77|nr:hypothetical protein [Burkholderia pseudomallei]KGX66197.1 hypothetical protein Y027_6050 [Burkholderia pseudomallei TSV5]